MNMLKFYIVTVVLFGLISCKSKTEIKVATNTEQGISNKNVSDSTHNYSWRIGQVFPENSIGVAYLNKVIGDSYYLTIRFPVSKIPDYIVHRQQSNYINDISIDLPPQTILLFDESGEVATLENVKNCISRFWCENDGGVQYEPTYEITIGKKDFKRLPILKDTVHLGKISCFSIANYNPNQLGTYHIIKEDSSVVMRGRLSTDYTRYAKRVQDSIYKYYDRNAEISIGEDESGEAKYCVMLWVYNYRHGFELGCCGP